MLQFNHCNKILQSFRLQCIFYDTLSIFFRWFWFVSIRSLWLLIGKCSKDPYANDMCWSSINEMELQSEAGSQLRISLNRLAFGVWVGKARTCIILEIPQFRTIGIFIDKIRSGKNSTWFVCEMDFTSFQYDEYRWHPVQCEHFIEYLTRFLLAADH